MLQTTGDKTLNIQVTKNKNNLEILSSIIGVKDDRINRSFENLSMTAKSIQFTKPKLTKPKKQT